MDWVPPSSKQGRGKAALFHGVRAPEKGDFQLYREESFFFLTRKKGGGMETSLFNLPPQQSQGKGGGLTISTQ